MIAEQQSRYTFSTATYLVAFAAACMLPLIFLIGTLLYSSVQADRAHIEARLQQVAGDLVDDLDRDLDRRLTTLRTLAASPALRAEDLGDFHAHARAAVEEWGVGVFLIDPQTGQILLSTLSSYGSTLPVTANKQTAQTVAENNKAMISNVFVGAVSRRLVFDILVPIERLGVTLALVLAQTPNALKPVLIGQQLDANWVSSVWDREGVIVVCSVDANCFAGSKLPSHLANLTPQHGVVSTTNMVGEPVMRAVKQSITSGWRIAIDAPTADIARSIRDSFLIWGSAVAIAVASAFTLALFFGRRLAVPLNEAALDAHAMAAGTPLVSKFFRVREANLFSRAMRDAQNELGLRQSKLSESDEQLRSAAAAAGFGTHNYSVSTDVVVWSSHLKVILGAPDIAEPTRLSDALSFIHPEDFDRIQKAMQAILAGNQKRYELEFRIIRRDDKSVRWVMDRGQAIRDEDNNVVRIIGVLIDITQIKSAEERQRLLTNELNHRVKNTLTIVQSIANQTSRSAHDQASFLEAFSSRLVALSSAHSLLTAEAWEGAQLRDIIEGVLVPFRHAGRSIGLSGDRTVVPANTVVNLSLIMHELATNAAKYGALSTKDGVVNVTWSTPIESEARNAVLICWRESGGPPVVAPTRVGFGSRLLKAITEQSGGSLKLEYLSTGLVCTVEFPLTDLSSS